MSNSLDNLVSRIEIAIRESKIIGNELNYQSIKDREIMFLLFSYYYNQGYKENEAKTLARQQMIKLILAECLGDSCF